MINEKKVLLIRKSVFLLLQIVLILSFGCGPAPTPILIDLPTATSPVQVPPTPSPTPQVAVTAPPASNLTLTPTAPSTIIKIFSHVPLTGEQAAFGQDILHGTELAIQQLS